jgi:hypothetical protein
MRVNTLGSPPGSSGITTIIVSVVIVSVLITLVTGSLAHWVPVTAAIVVGVWAVQAINK